MNISEMRAIKISCMNRVKYRTRKAPSNITLTTANTPIQTLIQSRNTRNSTSSPSQNCIVKTKQNFKHPQAVNKQEYRDFRNKTAATVNEAKHLETVRFGWRHHVHGTAYQPMSEMHRLF